ncbi:MAG: hypothetical protein ACW99U_17760 [Candidatus Thorarchaeota archaeon]
MSQAEGSAASSRADSSKAKPMVCVDSRPPECVAQFNRIENKIDALTQLMTGNKNPGVGVIVRMDRLEQKAAGHKWALRAIGTAIITVIVGIVIAAVIHFSNTGGTVP